MIIALHSGTGCACVTMGAAAGTILAAWAFMTFGTSAALQRAAGRQRPEGRLDRYDTWDVEDFLRRAGPGSRDLFRREQMAHIVFAAVAGTGMGLLLAGTWGRVLRPGHAALQWLVILPAVAAVAAAAAESSLLLWAVRPGRDGPALARPDFIGVASALSRVKWALVLLAVVAVMAGAITLAFAGTNRL